MSRNPQMRDIMTPFPYAIELHGSLADAEQMMAQHRIRHLPVTSRGEVYSVLSERELQVALAEASAGARDVRVRDICATDPYIAETTDPLDIVLEEMADRQIGCAVIAEDDRVAGVFTSVDACRAFADFLRANANPPPVEPGRDVDPE
jgi:acetoin utilization protein AcuB